MQNYELMTSNELKSVYDDLASKFEVTRMQMMELHQSMLQISQEAVKIKDIIVKRGGKI